jgi:hypothetical protein
MMKQWTCTNETYATLYMKHHIAVVINACFTCFMLMFPHSSHNDYEWMPYGHAYAHEYNANASLTPGVLQVLIFIIVICIIR